ncbi:MAG: hypothetical protein H7039_04665, partial [Bryobacteraceae bacterium]|nr:hypothetical protein [Bryobacteraceae bacterium]
MNTKALSLLFEPVLTSGLMSVGPSSKPSDVTPSVTPGSGAGWAIVDRISASSQLARSQRLKELLRYLCQRAWNDDGSDSGTIRIREHEIARDAFGRSVEYDSGQDTLVRVQVSQLRKRLERYFAEEGSSEPEVLLIPQGSYVPVLRRREQPQPPDLVVVPERPTRTSRLVLALAGLSGVLAIVCGVLLFQVLRVPGNAGSGPTVKAFWERFEGDQQTSVILADSALAAVQDALEAPVSVDQYAQRQWDGLLKQHAGSPDEMALL